MQSRVPHPCAFRKGAGFRPSQRVSPGHREPKASVLRVEHSIHVECSCEEQNPQTEVRATGGRIYLPPASMAAMPMIAPPSTSHAELTRKRSSSTRLTIAITAVSQSTIVDLASW